MEPRSCRIRRNKKSGIGRKFQCIALISTITIVAPGLIGATYGQFTDTEAEADQITACGVFPSVVEQSMKELITELDMLQQHVNQLQQVGIPTSPTGYTSGLMEESNSEQIAAEASSVFEYISSLDTGISTTGALLSSSGSLWQEMNREGMVIVELTNKLIWYSKTYNANCLELNSQRTLQELSKRINESALPEGTKQTVMKMIHYYDGIYHAGNSFEAIQNKGVLNKDTELRMFLREREISNQSFSSLTLEDIISEQLVLFFEQLQTSLIDSIQTMSAAKQQSLVLESSLISQAEEKKVQEELEEAEKLEGEKLPADGEQPIEGSAAEEEQPKIEEPAGDGENLSGEEPAAGEGEPGAGEQPAKAEQPAPGEPASEIEQPKEDAPPAAEEQPQTNEAAPVNEQLQAATPVQAVVENTEGEPVPTQQPS